MKTLKIILASLLVASTVFASSGEYESLGGGSGNVAGPASSTDKAIVRFDGTTGKLIQNGPVTMGNNGLLTFPNLATPITANAFQFGVDTQIGGALRTNVPSGAHITWSVNGGGEMSLDASRISIPTNDLVMNSGKLSIGPDADITNSDRTIDFSQTITNFPTPFSWGLRSVIDLNPSATMDQGFGGWEINVGTDAGNSQDFPSTDLSSLNVFFNHNGSGDIGYGQGLRVTNSNNGSGNFEHEQVGIYVQAISTGDGGQTGTDTSLEDGVFAIGAQSGPAGTGTHQLDYTYYAQSPWHNGTMVNHWGFYLADQEFGTNSWAIQTAGGKVQFGAPTGKNPLLYFQDGDVAHGITTLFPTDILGAVGPISSTAGGLKISGLSDTDATSLLFEGYVGNSTLSSTVYPIQFRAWKKNGTTRQAVGDTEKIFSIDNGGAQEVYVQGNGLTVFNGGTQGAFGYGYAETNTYTTVTGNIPIDDTIPQNTEGDEILSASITTHSASSKVEVTVSMYGSVGTAGAWWNYAFFRDSGTDAIAASTRRVGTELSTITYSFVDTSPGSAGSHTYHLRAGANTGNLYLNGNTSQRYFGGVGKCTLTVKEIL